jgi:hypothetical protein
MGTRNEETKTLIVGCCCECNGPVKLIETFLDGVRVEPDYLICTHCLREVQLES